MAFGVHALHVAVIVAPLCAVGRGLGSACSGQTSERQASAGADTRAMAAVDRCAERRADHCADNGAARDTVARSLVRRCSTELIVGIGSALDIVAAELIEVLSGSRQYQHTRAARNCNAAAQREKRDE
jgi:hypothetical protein